MMAVGDGVLHVKLKLIDFPTGEAVNQIKYRLQGRHFVPANIEHDAAHGKIRPILNREKRQHFCMLLKDLPQSADAVENSGSVRSDDSNPVIVDGQPIALST